MTKSMMLRDKHGGDEATNQRRLLDEELRSGLDVVEHQGTQHHSRGSRARNTQGEHGDEGPRCRRIVGSFRRGKAANITLAERAFRVADAFFSRVRNRARHRSARARQDQ